MFSKSSRDAKELNKPIIIDGYQVDFCNNNASYSEVFFSNPKTTEKFLVEFADPIRQIILLSNNQLAISFKVTLSPKQDYSQIFVYTLKNKELMFSHSINTNSYSFDMIALPKENILVVNGFRRNDESNDNPKPILLSAKPENSLRQSMISSFGIFGTLADNLSYQFHKMQTQYEVACAQYRFSKSQWG